MKPPTYQKYLQKLIGVINYYRNMWPRQSHTLATLTILTSITRKLKWTQVKQDDFVKIKRIVDRNALLTYPDFHETFKIRTGASVFQLGAIIIQKGKPIAFYSIKLTDVQQWYTKTEREILNIVETLGQFRTVLTGHKLIIYTYHKNLT